jgi:predicted O-methyltransferase YrrM
MERYDRHQDAHYHVFLSNIKQTGMADKVIPMRMTSLEASRALNVTADLVFIDADHAESAVLADIAAWMARVRPGGILCGDDYNTPSCPGVPLAVKRALPQHQASGRIWWVRVESSR